MKAHELLSDPTKFVKGHYALNEKGEDVQPTSPDATQFCALGAVAHCYGETIHGPHCWKLRDEIFKRHEMHVESFNNQTFSDPIVKGGYAGVLNILKELDL